MISNITRNNVSTLDFKGKFSGMRKAQIFTTYKKNDPDKLLVQSDTRIGYINTHTGEVVMSDSHASGAYNVHLNEVKPAGQLSTENLFILNANLLSLDLDKLKFKGVCSVI